MVRYLNLLIRSKDNLFQIGTPTENFTQFNDIKGSILCLKIIFLSGVYGKFHINFAVDNVFEKLSFPQK